MHRNGLFITYRISHVFIKRNKSSSGLDLGDRNLDGGVQRENRRRVLYNIKSQESNHVTNFSHLKSLFLDAYQRGDARLLVGR